MLSSSVQKRCCRGMRRPTSVRSPACTTFYKGAKNTWSTTLLLQTQGPYYAALPEETGHGRQEASQWQEQELQQHAALRARLGVEHTEATEQQRLQMLAVAAA